MKVRIAFRSDLIIEGETMKDVRKKWEEISLYSKEAEESGVGFIEIDAIEDADTYDNVEEEFYTV